MKDEPHGHRLGREYMAMMERMSKPVLMLPTGIVTVPPEREPATDTKPRFKITHDRSIPGHVGNWYVYCRDKRLYLNADGMWCDRVFRHFESMEDAEKALDAAIASGNIPPED